MRKRSSPQLAKLSRPRLYDALPRERLFKLLDEKRRHPAIWVSGPPGAGKTTLIASYLEARKVASVWYQLDASDSDPATAFYYLSELARQVPRSRKTALPYLAPEHLQDLSRFTRRFFRSFFARMPARSVLVLDNYQEAANSQFDQLIADALPELPDHVTMVIVSRSDPPLELTRMIANRAAAVLGWADLRLTREEGTALANAMGVTDAGSIDVLMSRCEGWAAGMTLLLATDLADRGVHYDQTQKSKEAVFDYFVTELFRKAPDQVQNLLLKTSLFPQFTAQMAAELTGLVDAKDVLERLYRQQFFMERRQGPPPLYRYHDLFREFLQDRMRSSCDPVALQNLSREAGIILRGANFAEAAIDLFRRAGARKEIADAVEEQGAVLLAQGRWQILIDWCEAAGSDEQRPWVAYWHGLAREATDAHAGRQVLEAAYRQFVASSDRAGQTLACSAIMDTFFQHWDTVAELDNWIARMELLLNEYLDMPAQVRARALSSMVVSLLHRQPGHPSLPAYAEEAYTRIPTTTDLNQKYSMAASLVYYYDLRGAMNRASELIAMTESRIEREDITPTTAITWWCRLIKHKVMTGEVDAAVQCSYRALELSRENRTGWAAYVSALHALLTKGALDAAEEVLLESRQALDTSNKVHLIAFYWLSLWLLVARGRLPEAKTLWEQFQQLPAAGVPIHTAFNHCVIVLLSSLGEHDEVLQRIGRYRQPLRNMRSPVIEFNLLTMEAYARLKAGDLEGGHACLEKMMALGRANAIMITLCWLPEMMSYLCANALQRGIEADYVRALIRQRGLTAPGPHILSWPRPLRILTLGRFELLRDESPIEFSRKAPKKLVTLLKSIVAHGERGVAVSEITDTLWADLEADAAHEALATNLHRLRKLLGGLETIRQIDGRLFLNTSMCWVDALAFDQLAERCLHAWRRREAPQALEDAERALEAYGGPFLPFDADQPWSVSMRERLRSRFIRMVAEVGAHYELCGDMEGAQSWYRRGIDADNLAEEFYQGLMRCYAAQGRRAEGAAVYRQLRQVLSVVLGVGPSEATQALGQQILQGR